MPLQYALERQKIRSEIRQRRRLLTAEQQQLAAHLAAQQIASHDKIQQANTIALFLSFDGELDTAPVIELLWQQKKQIYLPVLHPFSPGHLLFLHYRPDSLLIRNRLNILEPQLDVRQALPMVLSFLKMALVICLPLVLVISTYDLKTLVTTSCVQFALCFVDFWFQLARWIDSTILDALYGSAASQNDFSVLFGLNDSFGDMLLNFVMGTMFLVLPAFWITALAWSGVRAGNLLQGLSDGTRESGNAAAKGASTSINAAKR